jgi:dihydrofolate synthase/folylpolyglutamate synthase
VLEYKKTLQFLYDLQMFGMKVGLRNITALLDVIGHPEHRFPSIHIAGTNGKGSTSAMVASILTASGYRTGLYTSPHLVKFSERIRVDGKKISEKSIVRYSKLLQPAIKKHRATFFEATTAIALQYFADQEVDIAIIETGLGGRLDATNILTPILSIITNIQWDHTEHLGTTIVKIAREKGGIIKSKTPCITGTTNTSALKTLRSIAKSQHAKLVEAKNVSSVDIRSHSLDGTFMNFSSSTSSLQNVLVSLPGDHQVFNAQVALASIEQLRMFGSFQKISGRSIRNGLSSIQRYTGLRGRIDVASSSPCIIVDVAHNPDGIRTMISSLEKILPGKCVVVFGVMNDKEYRPMVQLLRKKSRLFIAVAPETERALASGVIIEEIHAVGGKAVDGGTVSHGLQLAMREARSGEPILVIGSHYVAGEVLIFLNITP